MTLTKSTLFFLLTILVWTACQQDQQQISGFIQGAENKTIRLVAVRNGQETVIDSTQVDEKGHFRIVPHEPLSLDFYRLSVDTLGGMVLITDQTDQLITIEGEISTLFNDAKIHGSVHTDTWNIMRKKIQRPFELVMLCQDSSETVRQIAVDRLESEIVHLLESNSNAPGSLLLLQYINPLKYESIVKQTLGALSIPLAKSEYFEFTQKEITRSIEMLKKTQGIQSGETTHSSGIQVGSTMPEIVMNDPLGISKRLSDLKGKVVLVDFWASWCGPCRRENPNIVALYKKFHQQGFEIFSISLDKNKDAWTQAIMADQLTWPNHVSQLQAWQSPIVAEFQIESIPFAILIDKKGVIRAYGDQVRGERLEGEIVKCLKSM
jgi:thiol-disulfide isomerase/thioredoxin